jgi:superfamily II DNA or RNA helicase
MTSINYANNMIEILSWLTKLLGVHVDYWQIDYNTKKTIREKIINNFKESKNIAIIINVHILDEGINISECDSVFITQPNNNIINIIQRMCRANRILDNKTACNIYLWCKEEKTKLILHYINENTQGFIKNKVYIYNTEKKLIEKHKMEINNLINHNNINNLINYIKKSKISDELDFDIKDKMVADYLNITLDNVRRRLQNKYSKTKKFIENVDFMKIKSGKTTGVTYMINYLCFEKIAMSGRNTII